MVSKTVSSGSRPLPEAVTTGGYYRISGKTFWWPRKAGSDLASEWPQISPCRAWSWAHGHWDLEYFQPARTEFCSGGADGHIPLPQTSTWTITWTYTDCLLVIFITNNLTASIILNVCRYSTVPLPVQVRKWKSLHLGDPS